MKNNGLDVDGMFIIEILRNIQYINKTIPNNMEKTPVIVK